MTFKYTQSLQLLLMNERYRPKLSPPVCKVKHLYIAGKNWNAEWQMRSP